MDFSSLIDAVTSFFTTCFSDLATICLALLNWFFYGLVYCVAAPIVCLMEGVLSAVSSILTSLDMSSLAIDWVGQLLGLPGPLQYLMHECGFDTGVSMISAAIVIRMLLNLIPGALTRI